MSAYYERRRVLLEGLGGIGGSRVEANPQEPATDNLKTIKIKDVVYNVSERITEEDLNKILI